MRLDIPIYLQGDRVSLDKAAPTAGVIRAVELVPKEQLGFKSDDDRYEITIEIEGTPFTTTANKTSLRYLASKFSLETDEWIGKPCVMWNVPQNVAGQLRNVIYIAPAAE